MSLSNSLAGYGQCSINPLPRPAGDGWERRRLVIHSCLVAVLSGVLFALKASAGFIAAPSFPAGPNPVCVAVVDFNGDGIPDLVVANHSSVTVSVMLGNGDGTFQAPRSYAVDPNPTSVAVGDFNRDGIPDIAVANDVSAGTVSILLGKGDGTFQAAQSYPAGSGPQYVTVADFDGDGFPDLAVVSVTGVSILLANGDGSFQAPRNYSLDRPAHWAAVADFNRDGRLDLITSGGELFLGNGDGTFQSPSQVGGSETVAVGDFNGDGLPDLAVVLSSFGGTTGLAGLAIFVNKGDGSFVTAQSFAIGFFPSAAVVGDFNGDGHLDIAMTIPFSNKVSVLLGNGDGSFQFGPVSYLVGLQPSSLAIGDVNRDGHLDLVVANAGSNTVTVLQGKGDGSFQPATLCYAANPSPQAVAVGDFNGDGHLDLAVGGVDSNSGHGVVSILLGKGDGSFQPTFSYAVGFNPAALVVGDLNGDGHLDIAVDDPDGLNTRGSVIVLLGNGDGTFQLGQSYGFGFSPTGLAVGDFNGDGHPDLAVIGSSYPQGMVSVLLGNGDGSFQEGQSYAVAERQATSVATADFNGDGNLDLAVASRGLAPDHGSVSVLLGNGDGTFQPGSSINAGEGTRFVAFGDFNGDGKVDIVTANSSYVIDPRHGTFQIRESDVVVFLGNGDGTFHAFQAYQAGAGPISVAVGDFNGDGIADLAVLDGGNPSALGESVTILLGKGDGTFQAPQSYGAGGTPLWVAVGDFNGDGYPDLAVADGAEPGVVTILINAAVWGGGR